MPNPLTFYLSPAPPSTFSLGNILELTSHAPAPGPSTKTALSKPNLKMSFLTVKGLL